MGALPMHSIKPLPYAVTGLASAVGRVVPIDEFAANLRFPDRKRPGEFLSGAFLRELLGLESKSWDRERFSRLDVLVETARAAIAQAGLAPGDVDALCLVTCTPLQLNLDQDAFALAERLQLPHAVSVQQIHAGCAGVIRVLHTLADLPYRNVVTVFYNLASPFMTGADGRLNSIYEADRRWFSAAIFADGAAAAVWSRQRSADGLVIYARDAGDTLIDFSGGGAALPPGMPFAETQMAYAIHTAEAAAYYREGMARNHAALDAASPGWLARVARYYVHPTGAAAVSAHYDRFLVDKTQRHEQAARYGNMSSPASLVMAHEDFVADRISGGAELAAVAVGAGPERGAVLFRLRLEAA